MHFHFHAGHIFHEIEHVAVNTLEHFAEHEAINAGEHLIVDAVGALL